jgi:hypothetical protein
MTQDKIKRLKQRYNPDNDLIPGAPAVTWADRQLLAIIEALEERVKELEGDGAKPDFGRFAYWLARELTTEEAAHLADAAEEYVKRSSDALAVSLETFLDTLGGMGCLRD